MSAIVNKIQELFNRNKDRLIQNHGLSPQEFNFLYSNFYENIGRIQHSIMSQIPPGQYVTDELIARNMDGVVNNIITNIMGIRQQQYMNIQQQQQYGQMQGYGHPQQFQQMNSQFVNHGGGMIASGPVSGPNYATGAYKMNDNIPVEQKVLAMANPQTTSTPVSTNISPITEAYVINQNYETPELKKSSNEFMGLHSNEIYKVNKHITFKDESTYDYSYTDITSNLVWDTFSEMKADTYTANPFLKEHGRFFNLIRYRSFYTINDPDGTNLGPVTKSFYNCRIANTLNALIDNIGAMPYNLASYLTTEIIEVINQCLKLFTVIDDVGNYLKIENLRDIIDLIDMETPGLSPYSDVPGYFKKIENLLNQIFNNYFGHVNSNIFYDDKRIFAPTKDQDIPNFIYSSKVFARDKGNDKRDYYLSADEVKEKLKLEFGKTILMCKVNNILHTTYLEPGFIHPTESTWIVKNNSCVTHTMCDLALIPEDFVTLVINANKSYTLRVGRTLRGDLIFQRF